LPVALGRLGTGVVEVGALLGGEAGRRALHPATRRTAPTPGRSTHFTCPQKRFRPVALHHEAVSLAASSELARQQGRVSELPCSTPCARAAQRAAASEPQTDGKGDPLGVRAWSGGSGGVQHSRASERLLERRRWGRPRQRRQKGSATVTLSRQIWLPRYSRCELHRILERYRASRNRRRSNRLPRIHSTREGGVRRNSRSTGLRWSRRPDVGGKLFYAAARHSCRWKIRPDVAPDTGLPNALTIAVPVTRSLKEERWHHQP
jgi:hypothetical protein